ncbi:hypothetical protein SETIT_2G137700v2 [Setaria italica]|uniref:LOB domain-containing protein n=1 Tax=Setaria italica TaxID=4555 RepID=K3ZZ55_SETIT|nr:hypothetical protein SETIT_2G137700v2 [Setaria italica]
MTGFGSPCGACKFLRRKCVKGCVFAPYFCHDQGAAHFAAIHKVFGASNASKLLTNLSDTVRSEAAVTMSYMLASLKAQASQGYTNEFLMPGTQQDNICENKFVAYQQGEEDVQKNGYYGMDTLQTMALAYLN